MPTTKEQSAALAASMTRVLLPQLQQILERDIMPNSVATHLEAALDIAWSKGYTQGIIEALDHVSEGLANLTATPPPVTILQPRGGSSDGS